MYLVNVKSCIQAYGRNLGSGLHHHVFERTPAAVDERCVCTWKRSGKTGSAW